MPDDLSKERIRELHSTAVHHRRRLAKDRYAPREAELLRSIANGCEVDPLRICPELVEVASGSEDEVLFRYASLHWSVPVSSGYGRRLRFLVKDRGNGKLIGLIGLCDPVFNVGVRDRWIGWSAATKEQRLQNVMEAFVLGAVPPYNLLLGGKLVALLAGSVEVRQASDRKYRGVKTRITQRTLDGQLALITTSSALGRSSIYNRLRLRNRVLFEPIGFTRGAGDFHFANGTFAQLRAYADRYCEPTYRKAAWGEGFRNRREVIKKVLPKLGLSSEWIYHGITRQVFVVHTSCNGREFLSGQTDILKYPSDDSVEAIAAHFRDRWLLPRVSRNSTFAQWRREEWTLWPPGAKV